MLNNALSCWKKNRLGCGAWHPKVIGTVIQVINLNDMKYVPVHQFFSSLYFLVNSAYSSTLIRFSISPTSFTCILAIHPSPSGPLFIVAGFSCSTSFASMTFPDTGVNISDADLTDSTAPRESSADTSRSMAGNSTKTTSPRACAAYTDIPIVPE